MATTSGGDKFLFGQYSSNFESYAKSLDKPLVGFKSLLSFGKLKEFIPFSFGFYNYELNSILFFCNDGWWLMFL